MKKYFLFLISILLISPFIYGQNVDTKYKILLAGASFASPSNGWFELGCRALNAEPINKAVNGQSIAVTANEMAEGKFYILDDLEDIDAFIIMHVHDKNVADESRLKKSYKDYILPFDYFDYAQAYDYVIKKYLTDCYNLRYKKNSKYYNTPTGKPAVVVLCTSWHDAREIFNPAIRKLGERWGFPVVEFDNYIGFSKKHLHPVTGKQSSILYAHNTELINGEEFGWHPYEGQDQYIQQRMATIFVDTMKRILLSK